jgi:voltage-gated potassium channel
VQTLAITAGTSIAVATVFYRLVEGWAVLDCFYMSAMTITTVGYGDFAPATAAGKLFTTCYALSGIGIMFALLGLYAEHMTRREDADQP